MRTEIFQPPRAARGHYFVSAVHGQAGKRGHTRVVQEVSHRRRLRQNKPGRIGTGHQDYRLFPEQSKEHPGLLPKARRAPRRPGAAVNGGTDAPGWRGAQDSERRFRKRLRQERRHRGGHARGAAVASARSDPPERPGEDRTGIDEVRPAGTMDAVEPLVDLARAASLLRAQSGLSELRDQEALSISRQGLVNPKTETWLLLNSGPGAADFNMALDEALLEFASRLGKPVSRFYGW